MKTLAKFISEAQENSKNENGAASARLGTLNIINSALMKTLSKNDGDTSAILPLIAALSVLNLSASDKSNEMIALNIARRLSVARTNRNNDKKFKN